VFGDFFYRKLAQCTKTISSCRHLCNLRQNRRNCTWIILRSTTTFRQGKTQN